MAFVALSAGEITTFKALLAQATQGIRITAPSTQSAAAWIKEIAAATADGLGMIKRLLERAEANRTTNATEFTYWTSLVTQFDAGWVKENWGQRKTAFLAYDALDGGEQTSFLALFLQATNGIVITVPPTQTAAAWINHIADVAGNHAGRLGKLAELANEWRIVPAKQSYYLGLATAYDPAVLPSSWL